MKKHITAYLFVAGCVLNAAAQQDLQFSQAYSNPYFFNPAAGGLMDVGEVYVSQRGQWTGVDGHPSSFYGSIVSQIDTRRGDDKYPLQEFNTAGKSFFSTPQRNLGKKHVLGGKFFSDQIGPFKKSSVQATYAIHLPISTRMNLGAGLGLGFSNFGIDPSEVSLASGGDPAYTTYLTGSSKHNFIDASAGIVMYNDKFFLSLSTTQLFNNAARFDGVSSESAYVRHYQGMVGYDLKVGMDYTLEPFAIAKFVPNAPLSFDAGARLHYSRIGFLSVSYRNQSALAIGVGCNLLQNFRFCYNYDVAIGATQHFGAGAHEIQLGFIFGHKRNLEREFKKDEQEKRRKKQAEEDL